ncbi:MAG: branched-chain amino acid ABC transporter permease [Anaerolineaceae bacterium]|nr:MAG: branched-chain amino acid ABC transporter permease [Anaerolineaceae bacterium]
MDGILLQQIVNVISLGSIYALFALGYSLVFSVLGVLNLAHSALFMWGAFIGLLVTDRLEMPLWVGLIAAMIVTGLLSVLLELIAFRPLRKRGAARIAQLISSIGAAILLVNIAQLLFIRVYNRVEAAYPRGLVPRQPIIIEELGLRITPARLIVVIAALVVMILLQYLVTRTSLGQQMRAVAFNQRTASLLGINVNYIFLMTFFLAGALGGLAGVLYALITNVVDPFIGQNIALIGLTAIVLGGMGSINGAVLGGFIVAGIQIISIDTVGSSYRDALVFLLLFAILLIRPQGILGQPESTRA